ncbi:MAG: hypothetical protein JW798_02475 [Prolixibacteraceae bacterium]|nr:hypothetical protein [Prolixibacteraceae bacterium]
MIKNDFNQSIAVSGNDIILFNEKSSCKLSASVYPNPCPAIFTPELNNTEQVHNLSVFNIACKKVYQSKAIHLKKEIIIPDS